MITYYTLITFLLCHWVFDFHLQTDEMAKNKSKDNTALFKHCIVYSIGIVIMCALNIRYFSDPYLTCVFYIFNTFLHFITDWLTSRASSALYKEERYHDFFVVIGLDQMIHYVTLFGTFIWLANL